ncbi:hypothetical protein CDAR_170721 [Caerostris darwini]|uniref:Uncharacterized protein n=1 Tax=Caerostris darwini TaxID=1538125 RepID=A0AAV4SBD9_9ARAC|nr:hypothetical protein CDAR_170721 [Caerostris darwini]
MSKNNNGVPLNIALKGVVSKVAEVKSLRVVTRFKCSHQLQKWESLIANIGGNMGLFLGLSLVTIVEVLEFMMEMITRLISPKNADPYKSKINVQTF